MLKILGTRAVLEENDIAVARVCHRCARASRPHCCARVSRPRTTPTAGLLYANPLAALRIPHPADPANPVILSIHPTYELRNPISDLGTRAVLEENDFLQQKNDVSALFATTPKGLNSTRPNNLHQRLQTHPNSKIQKSPSATHFWNLHSKSPIPKLRPKPQPQLTRSSLLAPNSQPPAFACFQPLKYLS
jgi:hypothetical protein